MQYWKGILTLSSISNLSIPLSAHLFTLQRMLRVDARVLCTPTPTPPINVSSLFFQARSAYAHLEGRSNFDWTRAKRPAVVDLGPRTGKQCTCSSCKARTYEGSHKQNGNLLALLLNVIPYWWTSIRSRHVVHVLHTKPTSPNRISNIYVHF